MYVAELMYPGTWLDYPDRDWCWKVGNQLSSLESPLADAALALTLFEADRVRPRAPVVDRKIWERDSRRRQEIEEAIFIRLGVDRYSGDRWQEVREEAELEFKHEQPSLPI